MVHDATGTIDLAQVFPSRDGSHFHRSRQGPYFNFVGEVFLGALSEEEVDSILDQGRERFSDEDCRYVREVSGSHPYLVQAAAEALWASYDDDHFDPRTRRNFAARVFYREAARTLSDIWQRWHRSVRHVFMAVAVEHVDALGGTYGLRRREREGGRRSVADIAAYRAEVDILQEQGFLRPDPTALSGLCVRSLAFLVWCAAELRRAATSEEQWERWLRNEVWDASPSPLERRTWSEMVRHGVLRGNVPIDLFAIAEGGFTAPDSRPLPSAQATVSVGRINALASSRSPVRLYISHVPEDGPLVAALEKHLAGMQREGLLDSWSRRALLPGADWQAEAAEQLNEADVALLCVSSEFVASDYCFGVEVKQAMQRRQLGEMEVVPVVLHPADWRRLLFGALEALPRGGKPISTWASQDEGWLDVVQGIRRVADRLSGRERQASQGGHGSHLSQEASLEESTLRGPASPRSQ